jgi:para-nitrobenzyl esterase
MTRNLCCGVSFGIVLLINACACAQQAPRDAAGDLNGTSWRLVKFQGSETLTPDDASKYTVAFDAGHGVSVRIDCNRGHGSWTSEGRNQIRFGVMALTRAMCPPAPLSDRLVKDWDSVRSYRLKDGHLFLELAADGGAYEFEPAAAGR